MRYALAVIALLSTLCMHAQMKAAVSKPELKLGEQGELYYEFPLESEDQNVQFKPQALRIPCVLKTKNGNLTSSGDAELEIIGSFKDTVFKRKNTYFWKGSYKITCWDTGLYEIPSTRLISIDSTYEFPAVQLKVYMDTNTVKSADLEISEEFVSYDPDYFYWLDEHKYWLISGLIVIIIGFIYYRWKKRIPVLTKKELSLKDRSLIAINGLEEVKLWQKNQLKEHYIELSFILKSYLSARYELNLMERTSNETTVMLLQKNLEKDTVETIKTILDYSDLAKFAKAHPSELEIYQNLAQVRQIVTETSPLEINRV